MTDFRALCAELLEWAEQTSAHYVVHPDVILRARAALAGRAGQALAEKVEGVTVETKEGGSIKMSGNVKIQMSDGAIKFG